MPGFMRHEPTLEEMEEMRERAKYKQEIAEAQLSEVQKRALIAEAKKKYGSDWTKHFSNFNSGINWSELKFRVK